MVKIYEDRKFVLEFSELEISNLQCILAAYTESEFQIESLSNFAESLDKLIDGVLDV